MASTEPPAPADLTRLMRFFAHELRNPLGALAIWLHLCRQTEDAAERARALAMIEDCCEALTRIAGNLEDCTALLEPGPRAPERAIDFTGLVRRVLEALGPAAARAGVTVGLDVPPSGGGLRVHANSERLARGLEALIRNAVLEAAAARRLVLRIEADAARVRLLVPLGRSAWSGVRSLRQQLAELPTSSGPSGLALTIACEIIGLYGGDLSMRATPGGGELVVQLPRASP